MTSFKLVDQTFDQLTSKFPNAKSVSVAAQRKLLFENKIDSKYITETLDCL